MFGHLYGEVGCDVRPYRVDVDCACADDMHIGRVHLDMK
jgi:hypothetical protein